jgi:hypothetical protein
MGDLMRRTNLAVTGVLTLAAGALVAVGVALSGEAPAEQPDTRPAGQVVADEPVTTTTVPDTTPAAPLPQDGPAPADDGPVNAPNPADAPADVPADVPPAGVPYDSDGANVVPNPTDLGPGEVAPLPPTEAGPQPEPPIEIPVEAQPPGPTGP